MNICLYGAASNTIDNSFIKAGEDLGELMAKRGHKLVYGAGAQGMMGAVSRGIQKKNGYVIGVVPSFFTNEEILNLNCNELIRTETMRQRKQIMEDNADAFIVSPGGIGTFEEFFEILTLKQLNRHNKPIVIFNINGYYDSMLKMLDEAIKGNFINIECKEMYPAFSEPEKVLDYIENYETMDLSKMKNK
jgi:uncharacterized protein (TIGR00730 family)